MISSTSPLSFLLYNYHNVSLDPNKKKMSLINQEKKIKLIIYQTLYFILLFKIKENLCVPKSTFLL